MVNSPGLMSIQSSSLCVHDTNTDKRFSVGKTVALDERFLGPVPSNTLAVSGLLREEKPERLISFLSQAFNLSLGQHLQNTNFQSRSLAFCRHERLM